MTIDVIIPTYQPDEDFIRLIDSLLNQTVSINKIIIINTDKGLLDSKIEKKICESEKVNIYHIEKNEFNHGHTRNTGVMYSDADIFVMMTQDAVPLDTTLVENLSESLYGNNIAAAYARQVPRKDAGLAECLNREFNYPETSRLKTKDDLEILGIKTYFCSNVCCGYNRAIFDKLGGFVDRTIFNEDMIYAAKAINAGYGIYYCGEAKVIHSHSYTCIMQFKRNVDLGISQAQFPEVFENVPGEAEGKKLVAVTFKKLVNKRKFFEIPRFIFNTGFRYLGYKVGKNYKKFPIALIKKMSLSPGYFE